MISLCYESTNYCNLDCEYCITADDRRIKVDCDYKKIIRSIAKFNPERLVISGGEPLLDKDLLPKLDLLNALCPNTYISLSTNGTVDFNFEELQKRVDCIDFSIPALDKHVYEIMRGEDKINKVIENVGKALDLNINIRISYMLTKENKNEINSVLDFAMQHNIKEVRIGRFFPFRTAAISSCKDKFELSDSEIENIMELVNRKSYPFKIVPPIKSLKLMETGYLTVNCMGLLFLPTKEGKVVLGKVFDIDVDNIITILSKQKEIFLNVTKRKSIYENYLSVERIRKTTSLYQKSSLEECLSDHSRIIYSSSFRRLQQKAQVFSLESNSSVRSRLTHSLEVADTGKLLATKITNRLLKYEGKYRLNKNDQNKIVSIVENACLIHDIGNPPFGHFGEKAIVNWWNSNKMIYRKEYNNRARESGEDTLAIEEKCLIMKFLKDFEEFDGNPQGLRIVMRLHSNNDIEGEMESGLNLTYSTILSSIKYPRYPGETRLSEDASRHIYKKCGHFYSEKLILDKIYNDIQLNSSYRFPWVYIMEAADDISYAMSDISDGIEKKIINVDTFLKEFQKIWRERYKEQVPETVLSNKIIDGSHVIRDFNKEIASRWASIIMDEVVEKFVNNIEKFINGKHGEIISGEDTDGEKILKTIKVFSERVIYRSPEAENIEVAGYSIITGLLEHFGRLLNLTYNEFIDLSNAHGNIINKNLDLEWRIFNMLSKRCVNSYKAQIDEWRFLFGKSEELKFNEIEWWLRVHLLIDHVSGMTDDYALKTYQVCKGINVQII